MLAAAGALTAGDLTRAASLLDQAHGADPLHPMVLTKQGELAMSRKDPARVGPAERRTGHRTALRAGLEPARGLALADRAWQGEGLTGQTLLVTDDQGHGDSIQFARYLPLLRDRGRRMLWTACPRGLRVMSIAPGPACRVGSNRGWTVFRSGCLTCARQPDR